jgi:FkbM family methyltransferase
MLKIFKFAKKYFTLIKEGYSLKDKIAITSYAFCFLLNRLSSYKIHNLVCDVTLKNKDGIFFCGNNIFAVWCGSSFHEQKLREYFNLNKGIFIDVGANIGKYAVMVGRRLKNKGKVIAFEPMHENFEILKKNIKLNDLDNVVIPLEVALGNREGNINFYIDSEGIGGRHSLVKKTKNKIKVKVRKLDNVLKELKIKRVDLIKIDVEGAEAEVLKGAVKTLKNYHPKIIFEAWDEDYLKKCKKVLDKFGYKVKKIDKMNYIAI